MQLIRHTSLHFTVKLYLIQMSVPSSSPAELEPIRHKTAMMDGQEGQADKAGATLLSSTRVSVFPSPYVCASVVNAVSHG